MSTYLLAWFSNVAVELLGFMYRCSLERLKNAVSTTAQFSNAHFATPVIETSALEGVKVDEAFRGILTEIYKSMVDRQVS